jgi:hypothetical protein
MELQVDRAVVRSRDPDTAVPRQVPVGLANCDFARGRESALVDAKGVKRSCWGSANLRRRGIRPPGLAARAVLCVCQEIAFRLFT